MRGGRRENRVRIPFSYHFMEGCRIGEQVSLVEDVNHALRDDAHRLFLDDVELVFPSRVTRVDHMEQQIGILRFLERCPERRHQMVRKLANESDRVGDPIAVAFAHVDLARQRVDRGEQAVLDEHILTRERLQKTRLARVRVAHERRRRDMPTAALVGYTNAGKSSLLKALSGQDVFVEDRLFATVDTLAREVDVGEGYRYRITDTVGFIRKLPHHLVASFRATLEEAQDADLLLHVIDASHPGWEDQLDVVEKETMSVVPKRVIHVFNKADLLPDPAAFHEMVRERYPHAILTSATTHGVEGLRRALRTSAQALRPIAEIRVPVSDGKLLATLHRDAEILEQKQTNGVVTLRARIEARLLGRLRQDGVEVVLG